MSIGTILVLFDGGKESQSALQTAFAVGRDVGAHIHAFSLHVDPEMFMFMKDTTIKKMVDHVSTVAAADRAAKAYGIFDDLCSRYDIPLRDRPGRQEEVSAVWIEQTGHYYETIIRRGRLSDLIVVGRSTPESEPSVRMILHAALFETGCRVMVAPPLAPSSLGRKIAIAWNGSAEASRAVSNAIPFLTRSEAVIILTAETDNTPPSVADELAAFLGWHGVAAEILTFSPERRPVAEALLGEASNSGADLLVMGGYHHSRMRQLILGGVTRHVLEAAELPVLMAH
jgi:nucleotide-binding universal stress UspA family protein